MISKRQREVLRKLHLRRRAGTTFDIILRFGRRAAYKSKPLARSLARVAIIASRHAHRHLAARPHSYLMGRSRRYAAWHNWKHHKHVHRLALAIYTLAVVAFVLRAAPLLYAFDLSKAWDFTDASQYNIDSGIETNGSTARLKAQNYSTDANTSALYHLDEASGSVASDSSSNANDGTVSNATFGAGQLNNALSFNGTNAKVSAPDSASLSLSQQNSLEAWTKLSSSLSPGSADHKQGIIDKGSYRLYFDQETGKVTYELADSSASSWSQVAGNDTKGSWDLNGKLAVNTSIYVGSNLYVGLGNAVGDAEVWKWDGTVWSQIGGDGKNSSWADQTYENVTKLTASGNTLYAGLGSSTGDAEVWSCDTSTGCGSWSKIGGDGINSGWAVNRFEEVDSMSVMGGSLYVGLGTSTNDAQIYKWNGTAWTWVGGFGIGAPYNAFTTGYEGAYSMANDGTNLYVGFGVTAGDADVWELSGTTWTQIGGDALNSSWPASTYETVLSMQVIGTTVYAGLGTTAGDAEVWSWNGSAWSKIGGDTVNSSWDSTSYEGVYGFSDDGTNLYAGLGLTAGDNEVWKWDGTSWTKIGGDGINSGFTNTHTIVQTLAYGNSTLFAGLQASSNNGEVWSWNGTSWTRIGGGYINSSWGYFNLQDVESMTISGNYLYAGTGNTVAGNAQVWRYDGSSWQMVGGQGINSSWSPTTYEDVMSMVSFGGNLYVGLGTTANDAEVWKWDGTSWTKIGGDSINSGWTTNYEEVYSMAVYNGNLYAGLGNSANDAEVWKWDGSSWTKIGGDSINSGWTTNYERVSSFAVFDNKLCAGLGASTNDAEVWCWSGTAWSKIGGDGLNSSWNTSYEQVESMIPYNGELYAGLGNGTGDAEVWKWNGTAWSQIGGDGLNSSWLDGQYEQAKSLVVYNGNLYAGLGNSAGDGEVWQLDNGSWSKVAGGGTNSSWASNLIETVQSFSVYHGKLYAGLGNTANSDAQVWSYGNNGFLQSSTSSFDTNWHHIAATYDGTTMKIYIDGSLNAQTNVTMTIPDGDQPLLIGSTFGTSETGWAQGYFSGNIDEVRISNTARSGFINQPYASTPQTITLKAADAAFLSGVKNFDNILDNETANGGTISYRVSVDGGTNWLYWDGSAWSASSGYSDANDVATANTNISTLPVTFYGVVWQAILSGDGTQQVTLNSVGMNATSDTTVPTAATSVTAAKSQGGSALASNDWTNGSSPYFSWTGGTDAGAGVKGYCLYLGTDNTADPITTKGLLGTSPLYTASHCQFAVAGSSVDLGTAGYIATPLTTSTSPYYLIVKTLDAAGNVADTTASFQFRFDNTAPANPGYITAPSGFVNTKTVTLTWPTSGGQAPSDGTSGLAGLQYRINSSPWYGDSHSGTGDINDLLANDGSYTTTSTPDFGNINDGVNTVYFRTWDAAGNVTSSYATAVIKINTSGAPSEPQSLQVTPATNTTNSFAFSWSPPATFVGDVNNLTYCYTVNILPSASSCVYTAAGVLNLDAGAFATEPGSNSFYVVAKDESNNINYASYSSTDFTANTPAPGMPTDSDIVDVSIKATSTWRLALTWNTPADTGAGIASYKVYRSTDNTNFSLVGSSTSTTYIDSGLSQVTYYYYAKACDSANNCGAAGTTVSLLPTGKFTSPALLTSDPVISDISTTKATISWSTDRGSDSKVAIGTTSGQYSPSEIGNSDQVTAHEIKLANLSAGTTYYVVGKWTDEDGNTGQSQEFSFTTEPPPQVSEVSTQTVTLSSATIGFTVKGANSVNLYYGLSDSFGGLKKINTSSSSSSYTIPLDGLNDGTKYFYKISAFDGEGTEYQGNVFSFSTPARPRISNLAFQPVAGEPTSTQQVSWTTNVPATSALVYGEVGTSGQQQSAEDLVTEHVMIVKGLLDNSQYFLYAQSRDKDGDLAESDRQEFHTALDTRPPKISNITIESSIRGTGAEASGQIVVSWQTDEPATSQVGYSLGSATTTYNSKTAEDSGLSTEHIVIVSNLPTSKIFSLVPLSKDKAGNLATGTRQTAIVGHASDSVLTTILNSLQKIFGF